MKREKLTEEVINKRISSLPGWRYEESRLRKDYEFEDFLEAFSFMTRAALVSEKLDHHPAWSNIYNLISIDLYTHDIEGVTEADLSWARLVDVPLTPRD